MSVNSVVDPVLKANVYDSLLNPDHAQPWATPQYSCSSGNCTWTNVTAFYVHPQCTDLSSQLQTSCNTTALNCTVGVPGGPSLVYGTGLRPSTNSEIISESINVSYTSSDEDVATSTWPVIQYVRALHVENIFASSGYSYLPINNKTSFVATACSFDICAQLLDISVHGTEYTETQKQVFCNGTYPSTRESFGRFENTTHYLLSPRWDSDNANPTTNLAMGLWAYRAVSQFLEGLFDGYTMLQTGSAPAAGINPTWEGDWYATYDVLQAIYNGDLSGCKQGEDYLTCGMRNTAKAITKSLRDSAYMSSEAQRSVPSRQSNDAVAAGDTFIVATFVRIHWWWLVLPALVWILSAVTLVGTVWKSTKTSMPGWRDNLLPLTMLYRGTRGSADKSDDLYSNQAWEQWAKNVHVALHVDKDHVALGWWGLT